jgi:hypothetical protein
MKSKIKTLSMMLAARGLVVALAAARMPAAAQTQCTPVIPDPPIGKLASSLIAAINSGDKEKIKSFVADNLSENALRDDSPEGFANDLQSLYRQTGGLDVVEIIPSKEPNIIRFKLRSKRGNHRARFVTRLDMDQPTKLDGWGLRPVLIETEKEMAGRQASRSVRSRDRTSRCRAARRGQPESCLRRHASLYSAYGPREKFLRAKQPTPVQLDR